MGLLFILLNELIFLNFNFWYSNYNRYKPNQKLSDLNNL